MYINDMFGPCAVLAGMFKFAMYVMYHSESEFSWFHTVVYNPHILPECS